MNPQLQIDFTQVVHRRENSQENETHLNKNRQKFVGQCAIVLSLLQKGIRLTSYTAMVQHGIGHLPRRCLDLKEAGVPIKSEFVIDKDGKTTRFKEYYLEL